MVGDGLVLAGHLTANPHNHSKVFDEIGDSIFMIVRWFFRCVHASLYEGLSVGQSVGLPFFLKMRKLAN